jgi:hypothetical protein
MRLNLYVRPVGGLRENRGRKKPKSILVHSCYSQRDGQFLPEHCNCTERVPMKFARMLVEIGSADWQTTTMKTGVVRVSRASIVRAWPVKTVLIQTAIKNSAATETRKLRNAEALARALNDEQGQLLKRVRRFLNIEFVHGHLAFDPVNLSDSELQHAVTDGREELATKLRPVAQHNLIQLAADWSEFVLRRDGQGLTAAGDPAAGLWPGGEVSGDMSTAREGRLDWADINRRRKENDPDVPAKQVSADGVGPDASEFEAPE